MIYEFHIGFHLMSAYSQLLHHLSLDRAFQFEQTGRLIIRMFSVMIEINGTFIRPFLSYLLK